MTALGCGGGKTQLVPVDHPVARPKPKPVAKPPVPKPPPKPLPIELPPPGRLGDNVTPVAYRLHVDLNPSAAEFSGEVRIDVAIAKATSSMWLHGQDLVLGPARLLRAGKPALVLKPLPAIPTRGLIGFETTAIIAAGRATLVIPYKGKMRRLTGLFRQRFRGNWYAFTDLEPTDARRAFPCFDDPRFKVPWKIALSVPAGQRAFANTKQTSKTTGSDGRVRFDFAVTKPLPSYLVAFASGPFEVVRAVGKTSVPLRIITPKGMAARGRYAAKHAPGLLAAAERYFAMKSPYDKLDLIAVPYFSGAMENPGLITIASYIMLLPDAPTSAQRKMFSIVASHEFAHLWFGDLVTMDYWNDLWLNEGFATWLSDKLTAGHVPKLGTRVEEVRNKADAMVVDRGPDQRAVRTPLNRRQRLPANFDELTYKKAGALVTMFEARIGAERFRNMLRVYVRKYAHKVVSANHLYATFAKFGAAIPAKQLASLVTRPGIPLVSVKPSCRAGSLRVDLRQRPYATTAHKPRRNTAWDLPVCLRYGRGQTSATTCVRVDRPTASVRIPVKSCPAWVMPNAGGDGYYHYELPGRWLRALHRAKGVSQRERADVALNLTALLRANRIDVNTAIAGLRGLSQSRNQHTLRAVLDSLRLLAEMLDSPRQRRRFAVLVRQLLSTHVRRIGRNVRAGESYDDEAVRGELLGFAAMFGRDPWLLRRTKQRAQRWKASNSGIDPRVALALRIAATASGRPLFDYLEKRLAQTRRPDERRAIADALGSFGQPTLTKRVVRMITRNQIRSLPLIDVLDKLFTRRTTRQRTYADASLSMHLVRKRMFSALQAFLPISFGKACAPAELARFDKLFAPTTKLPGEAGRRYRRARSRARQRITECIATRDALGKRARQRFR